MESFSLVKEMNLIYSYLMTLTNIDQKQIKLSLWSTKVNGTEMKWTVTESFI